MMSHTCSSFNCNVTYAFDQKSGQDGGFPNYFKVTMFAVQVCMKAEIPC